MRVKRIYKQIVAFVLIIALANASIFSQLSIFAAEPPHNQVAQFVADNHVLMLRADGRLIGWGDNQFGQLGLGDSAKANYNAPIEVEFFKGKSPIKQIAVIQDSSFVLLTNGDLYVCGKNTNGRLGLGDTNQRKSWCLVGGGSLKLNKLHINSSAEFGVAEAFDGGLYTWGKNDVGQCGTNNTVNVFTPTRIKPSANVKTIWVGSDYVSYIDLDNNMFGWGNLSSVASGLQGTYTEIQLGHTHSCGNDILNSTRNEVQHKISHNNLLQPTILNNSRTDYLTPQNEYDRPAPPHNLCKVDLRICSGGPNYRHTVIDNHPHTYCGQIHIIMDDLWGNCGSARCEPGGSRDMQLTILSHTTYESHYWKEYVLPVTPLINQRLSISNVLTGTSHSIYQKNGKFYGWGDNSKSQLGSVPTVAEPQELNFLNDLIRSRKETDNVDLIGIDVSRNTNFLRFSDGQVYVYGDNTYNKAGADGAPIKISSPTKINSLSGKDIISIVSGRDTTYYIDRSGKIYVSGSNINGQAGLGDAYNSQATINTPIENGNIKFSFTQPAPKPVANIAAPHDAYAGQKVIVNWAPPAEKASFNGFAIDAHAADAQTYELSRSINGAAPTKVYSGIETQYTDTTQKEWKSISYTVRTQNDLGDYSVPVKTTDLPLKVDNTPPTINSQVPTGYQAAGINVTMIITATDAESGVAKIEARKKGETNWTTLNSAGEYVITDNCTIETQATDNLGNIQSAEIQVNIFDKTAPNINVEVPKDFVIGGANSKVLITATDTESGVAKIEARKKGDVDWLTLDSTGEFTVTDNCSIEVKATDKVGNIGNVEAQINTFNSTAPTIDVKLPTETMQKVGTNLKVIITATDTGSGITKVEARKKGTTDWTVLDSTGEFTVTDNCSIEVKATDNVGNIANAEAAITAFIKDDGSSSSSGSGGGNSTTNVTVTVQPPNINIQQPNITVQQPDITVQAPPQPNINVQQPDVDVDVHIPDYAAQQQQQQPQQTQQTQQRPGYAATPEGKEIIYLPLNTLGTYTQQPFDIKFPSELAINVNVQNQVSQSMCFVFGLGSGIIGVMVIVLIVLIIIAGKRAALFAPASGSGRTAISITPKKAFEHSPKMVIQQKEKAEEQQKQQADKDLQPEQVVTKQPEAVKPVPSKPTASELINSAPNLSMPKIQGFTWKEENIFAPADNIHEEAPTHPKREKSASMNQILGLE